MSRLARFTLATVVVTFLLVTAGGLVRASDSGLGCGDDWPHCYGHWVPPLHDFQTTLAAPDVPDFLRAAVEGGSMSAHVRDSARSVQVLDVAADGSIRVEVSAVETWVEYTHRLLGTLAGLLTILVLVGSWRRRRGDPVSWQHGRLLLPLIVAQGLLGAYVVNRDLEAWTVVAHLGMAMSYVAVLLSLAVHLSVPIARDRVDRPMVRLAAMAAASVWGLSLLGSYVTGRDAGLAFTDWPLMDGSVVPSTLGETIPLLHFAHRVVAAAVGLFLVYVVREAARSGSRRVRRVAHVMAGLFGVQVVVGGLNVFTRLNTAPVTVHLSLSVGIFGTAVVLWALVRRTPALRVGRAVIDPVRTEPAGVRGRLRRGRRTKLAAYIALTKPRIIELLLVTTVPTMVIAQGGWPSTWLVVATVAGGTLAAGGANAINMYVDRDIDRLMHRTQGRPLVTGEIADPRHALVFAIGLEVAAFAWLWTTVNLLSASLALSATLFYVFVYTLWLKRTSEQNIVIGGAAGAVPVLVGWAAVQNQLTWAPWLLFAVIFVWTPPHFWALAIKYRDDYRAAEVPMLPAVASIDRVARQVLAYTVVVWAITLVFSPVAGMGSLYLVSAGVLGAVFTYYAVRLMIVARAEGAPTLAGGVAVASSPALTRTAMQLFGWSITYLTLLFAAMALDRLLAT